MKCHSQSWQFDSNVRGVCYGLLFQKWATSVKYIDSLGKNIIVYL